MRQPGGLIRVAHVIQNLNYGGMERVLHELCRHLPSYGFEVHVVVLEYLGAFGKGLESVATLHQVPRMSRLSLAHPGPLAGLLRAIRPDILHSHSGVWLKASRAAALANVPRHVHTEHGRILPIPLSDRIVDHLASRRTDIAVAVAAPLRDALLASVVHGACEVRLVPNGVDTERLRPSAEASAAARRALGIPASTPVIGSVGRLEPVKNYRLAIEALALLSSPMQGKPAPILVLVGDGQERASLEAMARTLGVSERVRFLGWRPDADRVYGAFDLFTLVSRSEGTSVSLLEAMSAGLCPVVTDVGGNRAVLGDDLAPMLVKDNDARSVSERWAELLADPITLRRMGGLARTRVETAYSLDHMTGAYAELYRELLGVRRRDRRRGGSAR